MLSKLNVTYISDSLAEMLSHIPEYAVTSVVAPMGYGKTRSIGWWSESFQKHHPDALILRQTIVTDSLVDFWRGFCRNLRSWPELESEMFALGFPTDAGTRELMAELLTDAIPQKEPDIFYILDDLHFLGSRAVADLVLFLSDRMPERCHIILLSRNSIFPQAAQMKMSSRLWSLTAEDLRLSESGVREYTRRSGQRLSEKDIGELAHSTEGWFSMVYLKLRAYVQNGKWPENTANIYPLIDEVLFQPLPERQREFLVRLGVPDDFTAAQAEFLWPDGDAAQLLKALTEQNAFITFSDGVYRYHNMLRSCARENFALLSERERHAHLLRLGQWYEQAEAYYLAELCYEQCGNWEKLLRAFFADQARSITGENHERMLVWYENCPEAVWKQNPGAAIVMLRKLFSFGRITEMHHMRDILLTAMDERDDLSEQEKNNYRGEVELNMSFLAFNDISAMSVYHRRACALMTRTAAGMAGGNWTFGSPSVLMLFHRTVGGLDRENAEMRECMPYFYEVTDGHGNGAEHVMQAETEFLRGNLTDAELSNQFAVAAAHRKKQYSVLLAADFLNAQMAFWKGDFAGAEAVMQTQKDILRRERRYALLYSIEMCRAWLFAILGQHGDEPLWLRDDRQILPTMRPAAAVVEVVRGQILLAKREWAAVAAREESALSASGHYRGMLLCAIWIELQTAAAYEMLGKRDIALRHLKTALDDAMPDGLLLPFVLECDYIAAPLETLATQGVWPEEIEKIRGFCASYRQSKAKILRECFRDFTSYGLTERETEIAKLAVQRKTNREIAELLNLAEGTVKNQMKHIFDKLGLSGQAKNKRIELEKLFSQEK